LSSDSSSEEDNNIPDYLRYTQEDYDEDEHQTPHIEHIEPEAAIPEANAFNTEEYDKYISAKVMLSRGDNLISGKVMQMDNLIGRPNSNPIFDTHLYQV
jgi:hypothetical protein